MTIRDKKYYEFICEEAEIIGIVNADDSVESKLCNGADSETHAGLFPNKLKRWRWRFRDGLDNTFHSCDRDDLMIVRDHITREYGIPFWDNGYHDLDFLLKAIEYVPDLRNYNTTHFGDRDSEV